MADRRTWPRLVGGPFDGELVPKTDREFVSVVRLSFDPPFYHKPEDEIYHRHYFGGPGLHQITYFAHPSCTEHAAVMWDRLLDSAIEHAKGD